MIFPVKKRFSKAREPNSEEQDIIKSLNEIRERMTTVYDRLNYSADELITDSLNYELLSLRTRHKFYIQKAKELNLRRFTV